MTDTHTSSQYLLRSIALDKPAVAAVWLIKSKPHCKNQQQQKKYSTNHFFVKAMQQRWTEAQP